MEQEDHALLQEFLEGNEEALHLLIKRYVTSVYNFVYRLSGNASDTEDITQETFIKVWRHARKFDPSQNFKTWLFTIAHRSTIDLLRKKKRFVFSDFDHDAGGAPFSDSIIDTEPLPDELFARAEEKEMITHLVAQLSPTHQEVLLLHYTEELTFDQIGNILGKSLNTVKSQHRRALAQLHKLLEDAHVKVKP